MKGKFLKLFEEAVELEPNTAKFEDKFREYDEWDSLCRLSVLTFSEEKFGVVISGKDFEKFVTVEDIFNYIVSKI